MFPHIVSSVAFQFVSECLIVKMRNTCARQNALDMDHCKKAQTVDGVTKCRKMDTPVTPLNLSSALETCVRHCEIAFTAAA